MEEEQTLVILKPEVLEQFKYGSVLKFYEDAKLLPIAMKQLKPSEVQMKVHYADLAEKYSQEVFESVVKRMTRGKCIFIVFQGENVIERVRKINGATNPELAEKGTIRNSLGTEIQYNFVHGSDCLESAQREVSLWFPELSHEESSKTSDNHEVWRLYGGC